jgi:hypothetical protein
MQANRRHMVTQVEIANKRSDEKKANGKEGRIKQQIGEVGEMKMRGKWQIM